MRFGKIAYLNLLPFDVFIKAYPLPSFMKRYITLKKSYPSKLNEDFLFGRIDAGFISSIAGMRAHLKNHATKSGIISKGAVWSVLALQGSGLDYQSATSNALLQVLNLQGKVLIGDRALLVKFGDSKCARNALDLGAVWWEKEGVPFVFGRLCFHRFGARLQHLSTEFNRTFDTKYKKIPYFILQDASKKSGIKADFIKQYLQRIFYKISPKERVGLERFYRAVRLKQIKQPQRFYNKKGV
ncbi:MqnA/MqnD/SBP family protein [Helicobacter himalayensis]|uniref:MqnA/MqnD/SBP family protein n=1 Tax=Helicobacter himalayensis TaxID=1591088 RepID=UPI00082D3063|nr:MqnA/MqnD/SBP family protein [Helicobacter himalayensis]